MTETLRTLSTVLLNPVERPLQYLFHSNKIAEEHREQKNKLTSAQSRVQEDVDVAKRYTQIEKNVLDWLTEADEVLNDAQSLEHLIEEDKKCFCWCPNYFWRYRISTKIDQKASAIKELVKSSTFQITQFFESKSSISAFDEIMRALKDDGVSRIGVWGMAGVGKTTFVTAVVRKVKEFQLFHKVIMVGGVSKLRDIENVQHQIADSLDLKFKRRNNKERKADDLSIRLKNERKVLIILDDMWNELDLKEIGIPIGDNHNGCKIILTTRRRQVCESMAIGVMVSLGVLDKEEAWTLFKTNASLDNASPEIIGVAEIVAKECEGLPLAIVTLARALRSKDLNGWKSTRDKLESSKLMEIESIPTEVEKNAYLSLEKSYDHLTSDEAIKKCFLLCANLYQEDHSNDVEDLVRFAWSMRLYQEDSIEETRSKVFEAINKLKDVCLLQDDQNRLIKMHNVVRRFARWMASKEGNGIVLKPENETFMQKLQILLLDNYDSNTPIEDFDGMQELKVLSLNTKNESCLFSFNAIKSLTNLRALQLKCFKQLQDISALAKLTTLEILSLRDSEFQESIEKLGELENLKVLDIRQCKFLLRFPSNVIQRLVKLEELYLYFSTSEGYESNIITAILRELKSLPALASLAMEVPSRLFPKNFVFPGSIKRYKIAINRHFQTDPMAMSSIKGYRIAVNRYLQTDPAAISSRLLTISERIPLNVISELLRNVEVLQVSNVEEVDIQFLTDTTPRNVSSVPTILRNLKDVRIEKCKNLQVIFQVIRNEENHEEPFLSKLERLCLLDLPDLEYIWKMPIKHIISLRSLKAVKLNGCDKLKYLFSFSVARSLQCLEELEINNCGKLMRIVEDLEGDEQEILSPNLNSDHGLSEGLQKLRALEVHNCDGLKYIFPKSLELPKLQKLFLVHLSELTQICPPSTQREKNGISYFPALVELTLSHCPKLTSVGIHSKLLRANLKNLRVTNVAKKLCEEIIQFQEGYLVPGLEKLMLMEINELKFISKDLCQFVTFQNLSRMQVFSCNNLINIFSVQFARNLPQLRYLGVKECKELEQVFVEYRILSSSTARQKPVYFPNLEEIQIKKCNKLKNLFPVTASCLPKLKKLMVQEASNLREIFGHDNTEANMKYPILLPNLEVLILEDLPKFIKFSTVSYNFELPSLNVLRVVKCGCNKTMRFSFHNSEGSHVRAEIEKSKLPDQEGKEDSSMKMQHIKPTTDDKMEWEKPRQFRQR